MVRLTWQISPRNKFSAYFDEIDKFRGHDMQADYDPETAAVVWNSPAYHTAAVKWTSPVTSAVPRSRLLEQHRGLHQRVSRGHREAALHAAMVCQRGPERARPGGYTKAGPINTTREPEGAATGTSAALRDRLDTP